MSPPDSSHRHAARLARLKAKVDALEKDNRRLRQTADLLGRLAERLNAELAALRQRRA